MKMERQCASCAKGSSETELYQIFFTYEGSTKVTSFDMCTECMEKMKNMIENIKKTDKI